MLRGALPPSSTWVLLTAFVVCASPAVAQQPDVVVYTSMGQNGTVVLGPEPDVCGSGLIGLCGNGCDIGCSGGTQSPPAGFNPDFPERYAERPIGQNMSLLPGAAVRAQISKEQTLRVHVEATTNRTGGPGGPAPVHAGDRQGIDAASIAHDAHATTAGTDARATAVGTELATAVPVTNENDDQGQLAPLPPRSLLDRALDFAEKIAENTDPVHPGRGEFTYESVDLTLPGLGIDFELHRYYRSRSSHRGVLGVGWTHSYEQYVVQDVTGACGEERVQWHTGDGSTVVFESQRGRPFREINGLPYRLRTQPNFEIVAPGEVVYTFDPSGPLTSIADREGHQMTFEWEVVPTSEGATAHRLTSVTDTTGRLITFTYDAASYLDRVTYAMGNAVVNYDVDTHGDLVAVTNPDLITETYEYLSGYPETGDYVPTTELDAYCEDRCRQPASDCSSQTECRRQAVAGIPACVGECFDPASCKTGCSGTCTAACQGQPSVAACTSPNGTCNTTCLPGCLAEGEDMCDDLESGDDDREPYWATCQKQCSALAEEVCDASLVCYQRFGSIGVGFGPNGPGVRLDGSGAVITQASASSRNWCVGMEQCRTARPSAWARRCGVFSSVGWMAGAWPCTAGIVDSVWPWPIADCEHGCYACLLLGQCPKFNNVYPAARGRNCTEDCMDGLDLWCNNSVQNSCPAACNAVCQDACSGQCTSSCVNACETECDDPSRCQTSCERFAEVAAGNCEGTCRSECRARWRPPVNPTFGHPRDLNHNLTKVRRGGILHVDNTYQVDTSRPDFDRVTRQVFGSDTIDFSYYDLATHYLDVMTADVPFVVRQPTEATLCPLDCGPINGMAQAEAWFETGPNEMVVFEDGSPLPPLVGPVDIPREWERYGWYEMEGTAQSLHWYPAVKLHALASIAFQDAQGRQGIIEPIEGGVAGRLRWLGAAGRDPLAGDGRFSVVRTSGGWRLFDRSPAGVVNLSGDGECHGDLRLVPGTDAWTVTGDCEGNFIVEEVARRPGSVAPAMVNSETRAEISVSGPTWRLRRAHPVNGDSCADLSGLALDPQCAQLAGDEVASCEVHWARRATPPQARMSCGQELETPLRATCSGDYHSPYTHPFRTGDQRIAWATIVRVAGQHRRTYYADDGGRVVRAVEPDGTAEDNNFDSRGRLIGRRSTFGDRSCVELDDRWNVTKTTRLPAPGHWAPVEAIEQVFGYDTAGDLTAVSRLGVPTEVAVSIVRDSLGRAAVVQVPGTGQQVTRTFANGALRTETNEAGHTTLYEHLDGVGVPSRITHGYGSSTPRVTTIVHDAAGRPTSMSTPGWATGVMGWTAGGFRTWTSVDHDLDWGTPAIQTQYGRDARGRRSSWTWGPLHTQWHENGRGLVERTTETSTLLPGVARETCYRYGPTGLVEEIIDPSGRRTRWTRDALGRVIAIDKGVWAATGASWESACTASIPTPLIGIHERVYSATYVGAALVREVTGTTVGVVPWSSDYVLDGYGRVVERELSDGTIERFGYTPEGWLAWEALYAGSAPPLPTGLATWEPSLAHAALKSWRKFTHDRAGRTSRVDHAWFVDPPTGPRVLLGAQGWIVETTDHLDASAEVVHTDPDGRVTRVHRDALGRVSLIEYPDGIASRTLTYSATGRTITDVVSPASSASGAVTMTTQLTPTGGVSEVNDGATARPTVVVTYDELDRPQDIRKLSRAERRVYGAWGRVGAIEVEDAEGSYQTYLTLEHDAVGRQVVTRDATGAEWSSAYDALGRLATYKSPTLAQTTYLYRAGTGRPASVTTPDSTLTLRYDERGHLAEALGFRASSASPWREARITFEYGATGLEQATSFNKSTTNSDDVTTTFVRDSLGRPYSQTSFGWPSTMELRTTPSGLPSRVQMGGRTIDYSYDALGRRAHAFVDGAQIYEAGYAGWGPAMVLARGNGVAETTTFDDALRTRERDIATGSQSLYESETWWTGHGLPLRTDAWWQGASAVESDVFETDHAGRLTGAWHGIPSLSPPSGVSGYIDMDKLTPWVSGATRYELTEIDAADRWTSRNIDGLTITPSYGADHRMTDWKAVITTDASGRTLGRGPTTYGYDGFGRLVSVAVSGAGATEMLPDAWGRVVSWTAGAGLKPGALQYNDLGIARERREVSPGVNQDQLFVAGHGKAPAALVRPADMLHLHSSDSGRIDLVTDAGGAVVERLDWRGEAEPRFWNGSTLKSSSQVGLSTPYLGAPYFAALRIHQLGARWYEPERGAFLSSDPAGLVDGPNAYSYGRSHPIMHADASGLALQQALEGLHKDLDAFGRDVGGEVDSDVLGGLTRWGIGDLGGLGLGLGGAGLDGLRFNVDPLFRLGMTIRNGQKLLETYEAEGIAGVANTVLPVGTANEQVAAAVDAAANGDVREATYLSAKAATTVVQVIATVAGTGAAARGARGAGAVEAAGAAETAAGAGSGMTTLGKRINPGGHLNNCGSCAVALDRTLGGAPASAINSGPLTTYQIAQVYGMRGFASYPSLASIEQALLRAGDGARGIVYGAFRDGELAHAFNAVNQGGKVAFLDAQVGTLADTSKMVYFEFLMTHGK